MKFKFLEHTADVKFQAFGSNLEEAFENSVLATINVMSDDKIQEKKKKEFRIKAKNRESLLYNLIEEILFLLDSENFIPRSIKVKIKEGKILELYARVKGDNAENYQFKLDVKAVTYNSMFIREDKDKWVCQVVLDV